MKHEESKLQIQCVKWFRLAHPKKLIYAIPNGGKRGVITASIMKAEGVTAGVPDLHIPMDSKGYHSLYIELKTAKGVLSPKQKEIGLRLMDYGNCVITCRSLKDFQLAVTSYFNRS
jgi:hypothetical protein